LENQISALEIVLLAPNLKSSNGNEKNEIGIKSEENTETRFNLIPLCIGKQQIRIDFFSHYKRVGTVKKQVEVLGGP